MNNECIKVLINISYNNIQFLKLITTHSNDEQDLHKLLMDKIMFIQFTIDNVKHNESVFFQIIEFLLLTYNLDMNVFRQMQDSQNQIIMGQYANAFDIDQHSFLRLSELVVCLTNYHYENCVISQD